jgi:hypothetical protein
MIDDAYISEADLPDDTLWLAKTFKLFLPLTGPTSNQIVNPSFIRNDKMVSIIGDVLNK